MNHDELVKELREYAEEYPPLWREMCEAADAIEELQAAVEREKAFADCWEEMAQDCKARFEKLALQQHTFGVKRNDDMFPVGHILISSNNPSESGIPGKWVLIANESLWRKVENPDPCDGCRHSPPSSADGKPCCACDPDDPLMNCREAKEDEA